MRHAIGWLFDRFVRRTGYACGPPQSRRTLRPACGGATIYPYVRGLLLCLVVVAGGPRPAAADPVPYADRQCERGRHDFEDRAQAAISHVNDPAWLFRAVGCPVAPYYLSAVVSSDGRCYPVGNGFGPEVWFVWGQTREQVRGWWSGRQTLNSYHECTTYRGAIIRSTGSAGAGGSGAKPADGAGAGGVPTVTPGGGAAVPSGPSAAEIAAAVTAGAQLAGMLGGALGDWLTEDPAERAARLRYLRDAASQFSNTGVEGEDERVECVSLFDSAECEPGAGDPVWRVEDGVVGETVTPQAAGESKWRAGDPDDGEESVDDRWTADELNAPNCSTSPEVMTPAERERWRSYCGVEAEPDAAGRARRGAPPRGEGAPLFDAAEPVTESEAAGDFLSLPSVGDAVRTAVQSVEEVWNDDVVGWVGDHLPDGALRNAVVGIRDVRGMPGEVIETIERGAAVDISLGEPGDAVPFNIRPRGRTPQGRQIFGVLGLTDGAADRLGRTLDNFARHVSAEMEGRDVPMCNPWGGVEDDQGLSFWTNQDLRNCP